MLTSDFKPSAATSAADGAESPEADVADASAAS